MPSNASPNPVSESLLSALGATVRERREELRLSRPELARRASLSLRFLAQFEVGESNIAISRLDDLGRALGWSLSDVIQRAERRQKPLERVVALLGLRGAGKSAIGRALAERLGVRLVEHDQLVEEAAGLSVSEVFALHGEDWYRGLARQTLVQFLSEHQERAVLATGGGIVEDREAFAELLGRTTTIWLQAEPADHYRRVEAQGDRRPMRNRPDAMQELKRLLASRARLYAQAQHVVATSGRSEAAVVDDVMALLA